jgi:hypothetical protein
MGRRAPAVSPAVLALALLAAAGLPAQANPMKIVVLRGLDKITAHISTF